MDAIPAMGCVFVVVPAVVTPVVAALVDAVVSRVVAVVPDCDVILLVVDVYDEEGEFS